MAKDTVDYDSIIKNLRKDISNLRKEQNKIHISDGPKTKINKEYSVHVDDREGLIKAITSGMSYYVVNDYFYFYREETDEEFAQRQIEEEKKIEATNLKIKSIEDQITKIEEQIRFLKSEKNLKYQNPEYIEYLRLRSKFEEH